MPRGAAIADYGESRGALALQRDEVIVEMLDSIDRRIVDLATSESLQPIVFDWFSCAARDFREREFFDCGIEELAGGIEQVGHAHSLGKVFPNCQGTLSRTCPRQFDMPLRKTAIDILAINLRWLMERDKLSEGDVAKKAGIDKKTINNILNRRNEPQLDIVEAVAKAFGLEPWQLLVDGMGEAMTRDGKLGSLIEAYAKTDDSGRESMLKVAEIAVRPYLGRN